MNAEAEDVTLYETGPAGGKVTVLYADPAPLPPVIRQLLEGHIKVMEAQSLETKNKIADLMHDLAAFAAATGEVQTFLDAHPETDP